MQPFVADNWKDILKANQLDSFDAWWQLDADWFEEPNERRGGWSGVSRVELEGHDGSKLPVFLKRQQEHTTKTLAHPIKGILTFAREMQNILAYQAANVPALDPVYFEEQVVDDKRCAVLVTVSLEGYSELQRPVDRKQRHAVITACADTVKRLHAARLQHNCLYPKHLFVRMEEGKAEARLIDLEKTKHVIFRRNAVLRDLDSFNRHSEAWSRADKLRFLLYYLDKKNVDTEVRELWGDLVVLMKRKQRKKA